jgi:hypothetical protein
MLPSSAAAAAAATSCNAGVTVQQSHAVSTGVHTCNCQQQSQQLATKSAQRPWLTSCCCCCLATSAACADINVMLNDGDDNPDFIIAVSACSGGTLLSCF